MWMIKIGAIGLLFLIGCIITVLALLFCDNGTSEILKILYGGSISLNIGTASVAISILVS